MEQGRHSETVLRKYPNRRIYDPQRNSHITLSEIADRVKTGERVKIVDHKTGDDLTHVIMGQVLFETLKSRPDYLPLDLILLMIRAHDNIIRGFLHHALPQAFQMYMDHQRRLLGGMNWFSQGFQSIPGLGFPTFGTASSFDTPAANSDPKTKEPPAEDLKEELEKLKKEVKNLKSNIKGSGAKTPRRKP